MARCGGIVVVSVVGLLGCTNDYDGLRAGDAAAGGAAASATSSGPVGSAASSSIGPGGAGGAGATGGESSMSSVGGAGPGGSGGAGGAAPCKLAELVDKFGGSTVDEPPWEKIEEGGGLVTVAGSNLVLAPSGAGPSRAEILSAESFDLQGCSMHARSVQAFADDLPIAHYMKARVTSPGTWLRIGVSGGNIRFEVLENGMDLVDPVQTAFDPEAHAWWSIRELAGMVRLETSPDKASWTPHLVAPTPWFASDIRANLGATSYTSSPGDPGEARFDDFNQ
jgi:hypothetical protein